MGLFFSKRDRGVDTAWLRELVEDKPIRPRLCSFAFRLHWLEDGDFDSQVIIGRQVAHL
jgi:hypothetical protein